MLAIALVCLIYLFPIYWLVVSSFKPVNELISVNISYFPGRLDLGGYQEFFADTQNWRYILNSTVVASATTITTIGLSAFAAYSLARLRFPGRTLLSRMVLFTYVVPKVLLIIPVFVVMFALRLNNTLVSLVLAHITFALPFCVWMLRGFFASIPPELEEAAMIDGSSRVGALLRVALPLSAPGLVAAALFTFILSWNEYVFALVLISKDDLRTLPLGLAAIYSTSGMSGPRWSQLLASSVLTSLPVFAIFAFLQRFLVRGLTAGAVKG